MTIPDKKRIDYGCTQTPFGLCSIAFTEKEVLSVIFPDNEEKALEDFKKRLGKIDFRKNDSGALALSNAIFIQGIRPKLLITGTTFQQKVWEALLQIPMGETRTYAEIAKAIGYPKAVRAVGTAIGANPFAYLIPCHRVLRSDGGPGGFRWGLEIKKKMLKKEGVSASWM